MNKPDLLARLQELEAQSETLRPAAKSRRDWWRRTFIQGEKHLQRLNQERVPVRERSRDLEPLAIGDEPRPFEAVFEHLNACIATDGLHHDSGRMFGFVPGSSLFASALGDFLAALTNRYTGARFAAPEAVRLERELLQWLAGELGYPATARGDLASGGSIATLTALVAAREAHAIRPAAIERSVVYLTGQAHHCIVKALHILGLDDCPRRLVAMDDGYRMRPDSLRQQIRADRRAGLQPWLLIANAGSVDLGAVDPLAVLARIAAEEQLWLHVDGAYGAAFALCRTGRERLAGLAGSDSLVIDPHKGLFTPFGCGVVLVRDGARLAAALSASGEYMHDAAELAEGEEFDPHQLSLELSRPYRALRLWLPLQLHGGAPFRAALEEKLLLAEYAWQKLQAMPDIEVLNRPDLSIIGLRAVPRQGDADRFNRMLLDALQQEGEVFLSSTRIDSRLVIRLAILSRSTHRDDVDLALERLAWHCQRL